MLLPPNRSKQEQALVNAIDYHIDPSCIRGFKLKSKELWLIEEYGLEKIISIIGNKDRAVEEGIRFQRLRGTLESLKIAFSWANIDDITIIEEPPGQHFAEFQIGTHGIPDIKIIIDLTELAAPARSRLMRIFNDDYNIKRLILDESLFGDLLSDYSGRKITEDSPVLSFGRRNRYGLKIPNPSFKFATFRNHNGRSLSNDIYRLDIAILGETEPHTRNYKIIHARQHKWYNFEPLYPSPQSLLPPIKFTKAQVVLSDSWQLEDINSCFPANALKEKGTTLYLDKSKLSEQFWSLEYVPILERFSITYSDKVRNYDDQKVIGFNWTEYHVNYIDSTGLEQKGSIHELEHHIEVLYLGVVLWHEHRHLDRSWTKQEPITSTLVTSVQIALKT